LRKTVENVSNLQNCDGGNMMGHFLKKCAHMQVVLLQEHNVKIRAISKRKMEHSVRIVE
jgi:hypothetical protein